MSKPDALALADQLEFAGRHASTRAAGRGMVRELRRGTVLGRPAIERCLLAPKLGARRSRIFYVDN